MTGAAWNWALWRLRMSLFYLFNGLLDFLSCSSAMALKSSCIIPRLRLPNPGYYTNSPCVAVWTAKNGGPEPPISAAWNTLGSTQAEGLRYLSRSSVHTQYYLPARAVARHSSTPNAGAGSQELGRLRRQGRMRGMGRLFRPGMPRCLFLSACLRRDQSLNSFSVTPLKTLLLSRTAKTPAYRSKRYKTKWGPWTPH